MEPKPRSINPEKQHHPEWLKEADTKYSEIGRGKRQRNIAETNFIRGNPTVEMLNQLIPTLAHDPNILIVGLGFDGLTFSSCYEPFIVAAHMEEKNINYKMTLIDLSKKVINDVKKRTTLFLPVNQHDEYTTELEHLGNETWEKYLTDTKQTERILFSHEKGMILRGRPIFLQKFIPLPKHLKKGIRAAKIPEQFGAKIENGDIKLIQADIADADLSNSGEFDYAELTNILYLMDISGQKLALANISAHMKSGGLIQLDVRNEYFPSWLDEEKLDDLRLTIEKNIRSKSREQAVVLRRK